MSLSTATTADIATSAVPANDCAHRPAKRVNEAETFAPDGSHRNACEVYAVSPARKSLVTWAMLFPYKN